MLFLSSVRDVTPPTPVAGCYCNSSYLNIEDTVTRPDITFIGNRVVSSNIIVKFVVSHPEPALKGEAHFP
jgi:hypothetical protein